MKATIGSLLATVAVATAGALCAVQAQAGCSGADLVPPAPQARPQAASPAGGFMKISTLNTGFSGHFDEDAPIVGMWKVKFVTTSNTVGIPANTVVDDAYVTWHSDGTEIMNSNRAPLTGSFCMGVWRETGHDTYGLNHFAKSWDPTGSVFVGPTQIQEIVKLDRNAMNYAGTFTIDQYSIDNVTVLAHIEGKVTAKRITVASAPQ